MHGKENIINKKNIAEVSQDNCSFEDKPAVNMCVGYDTQLSFKLVLGEQLSGGGDSSYSLQIFYF